ncbi:Protein kinase C-binding protein 1 [Nymphon striatum]|nr:Protein kinase C-binding protein 1 [Nymphon striatum]
MASCNNECSSKDDHEINLIDNFSDKIVPNDLLGSEIKITDPSTMFIKEYKDSESKTETISEIDELSSKKLSTIEKSNREVILCNEQSTSFNLNNTEFNQNNLNYVTSNKFSAIEDIDFTPNLIITDVKSLREDLAPSEYQDCFPKIEAIDSECTTNDVNMISSPECSKNTTINSENCSEKNIDSSVVSEAKEMNEEASENVEKEAPAGRKFSSRIRARLSGVKDNVKNSEDSTLDCSKSSGMNGFSGRTLLAVAPTFNQLSPSMTKGRINDPFCWVCHKENVNKDCVVCPRAFHSRCIQKSSIINQYKTANLEKDYVCSECQKIMAAEDLDFHSQYSSKLSLEQLCLLLQFAIHRLKHSGAEPFLKPVSHSIFPSYRDYIISPMDLFTLECNVKKKMYGSTHSFLADVRWILHNCIIFNGYHHQLTTQAKTLMKSCKLELNEIETCPSCYLNSCTKIENWFARPCAESHTIIWAKMRGFPFWPAKVCLIFLKSVDICKSAMKVVDNNVDARFFGAHDRAWVPINQCYLYSKEIPATAKIKKKGFDDALEEVELYIELLKQQFSSFKYASSKVPLTANGVHVPKKFTLDIVSLFARTYQLLKEHVDLPLFGGCPKSWLEKQHIKAPHLNNSNLSHKQPAFQQIKDSNSSSNSEDLVNGMLLSSGGYSAPSSVPSYLGSSPSLSPTSDISCAAQAITVTTTESDCVTFGGSPMSPTSADLTSKNVPVGVFELSPNMKATMPRKLDVKVPKLDPARFTKSRSLDQVQKLKQAMEKIEDSLVSIQQTEEQCLVKSEISVSTSNNNYLTSENQKDSIVYSPSCEVTSTTVVTSDYSAISDASSTENSIVNVESPEPMPSDAKIDVPKPDNYKENLGKTIENCKAMLGIEVCDDVALVESESDSDDQIHTDLDNRNESLMSDSFCTIGEQSSFTCPPSGSSTIDGSILNQKFNIGKHKTSYSGPHTKRLRLSKICSEDVSIDSNFVNVFEPPKLKKQTVIRESSCSLIFYAQLIPREAAYDLCILNQKNSTKISDPSSSSECSQQVQCDDSPDIMSRNDMNKYSNKVMDFMKGTMAEMCKELGGVNSKYQNTAINALRMEIEMLNLRHQQEIAEISHNSRLVLMEMRNSLEIEKMKALALLKESAEKNLMEVVAKTKKKQWCANCGNEAMLYCCWNTSYCDYHCQHKHWKKHVSQCTQKSSYNKLRPPDQLQVSKSSNDNELPTSLGNTNVSNNISG